MNEDVVSMLLLSLLTPLFFVRGFGETNWNLMSTLLVFDPANGLRPEAGDISDREQHRSKFPLCVRNSLFLSGRAQL